MVFEETQPQKTRKYGGPADDPDIAKRVGDFQRIKDDLRSRWSRPNCWTSAYRPIVAFRRSQVDILQRKHEEICQAVISREGESAALAMRRHVQVLAEESLAAAKNLRL